MVVNRMRKILVVCLIALATSCSISVLAQSLATNSLFQELGSKEGIKQIVGDFLPIVLNDARIKNKFEDVDIDHLAKMLTEQFCELSGGPCKYSGKDMKTMHADLAISNAQFNALVEDLQLAMEKHSVSARAQNKMLAKLAPMQRNIVTK
jgi:hemoglobin